ncbi:di-heme enzyme [soil metagenome]
MRRSVRGILLALACTAGVAARLPDWRWALPAGVARPLLPPDNPMTAVRVELGRRLFYDADLSLDGTMACAACHEQKHGFADGNRTRSGVTGEAGRRNVPGLANVAWMAPLTWADPRQTSLEAQVAVPMLGDHPVEMGMKGREAEISRRLARDPCYVRQFRSAFPERQGVIGLETVALALAAFERTLVSFGSAYDRGEFSEAAGRGGVVFARACANCHGGPHFADGAFHRLEPVVARDRGLGEITGRIEDDGRFRTPGLRNVAVTAPYFHDGAAVDLGAAIERHGIALTMVERGEIIAFLEALTDPDFLSDPRFALPQKACGRPL